MVKFLRNIGALIAALTVLTAGAAAWAQQGPAADWGESVEAWYNAYAEFYDGQGGGFEGFGTGLPALSFEGAYSDKLIAGLSFSFEDIAENEMMGPEAGLIPNGGLAAEAEFDLYYRVLENEGGFLDAGASFFYSHGVQELYAFDEGEDGLGRSLRVMDFYGPSLNARGLYMIRPMLGVKAEFSVSPHIRAHTVSGGLRPSGDAASAVGWRYKADAGVVVAPADNLEISGGYRSEQTYFETNEEDSFDLEMETGGPYLEMMLTF